MAKICKAFSMEDPQAAEHIDRNLSYIVNYGDEAYGHFLHLWDDGGRRLGVCKECGAYILLQKSEYESFCSDYDDDLYRDYFHVEDEADADRLNREYGGYELENNYPGRWLQLRNRHARWEGPPPSGKKDGSERSQRLKSFARKTSGGRSLYI